MAGTWPGHDVMESGRNPDAGRQRGGTREKRSVSPSVIVGWANEAGTGKPIKFSGMVISRWKGGKIVEAWNNFDLHLVEQQLG